MRDKEEPTRRGGTRPAGVPRAGRGRAARWLTALRAAAWVMSALILLTCGVTHFAYRSLTDGLSTSDALDAIRKGSSRHLDNSVNLLLVGLDSRKDMDGNDLPKEFVESELHAGSSQIGYYNTNTLILMHIPADGGKASAFSIPRDDYVDTLNGDGSPQGKHKIKEAYAYAYTAAHDRLSATGVTGTELERKSREAGRRATLATVQDFTGVPIDHFAEVNLLGFYDIAKVLQPITVCLKNPVKDRYSGADFPAGVQKLNARQALAFVRQRHGLTAGDLDRTRRQQAFISSVTHQLKTQGVWGDVGKLTGLLDVVKKDVVLDSSWNLLDFAQQAPQLTGGNTEFHTLPIAQFATRNGESVNLVDPAKIKAIVQQAFTAKEKTRSDTAKAAPGTVDVFNGNGAPGLADSELKDLVKLGHAAGTTGNAVPQQHTTVTYGSGAREAATQIAARLKAATAQQSSDVPSGHVRVTLGHDYTPRPEAPAASDESASESADSSGPAVKSGGIPCVN
ncbi:LCP family protein [Streptomyces sp. NPDC096198]|uniref:LCP family protein n=1 Tax=Streptomyces sp. NPDC096198 TaxID=3366080 RepID=UPI0038289923